MVQFHPSQSGLSSLNLAGLDPSAASLGGVQSGQNNPALMGSGLTGPLTDAFTPSLNLADLGQMNPQDINNMKPQDVMSPSSIAVAGMVNNAVNGANTIYQDAQAYIASAALISAANTNDTEDANREEGSVAHSDDFSKDWSSDLKHIPPNERQAFLNKVRDIARRLQMNPDHLMAIMKMESGINPRVQNRLGSGATGLIQFMPATARNLGTTTSALRNMSALKQLDYVEKYLTPYKGRMNTSTDAYMAVFSPAFIGKGDAHVAYRRGQKAYEMNKVLDVNGDGKITNGELGQKLQQFLT